MAIDAFRSPVCSGRLLIALGRWLICTVFVYAAAGVGAQTVPFQQVPEFETWIQEADKSKKDPVDFVQAMRAAGSVTFAQSRSFNKYVLARIDARIAKLDAEAKEREVRIAKLDAEAKEREVRIAQKDAEAKEREIRIAKMDAEAKEVKDEIAKIDAQLLENTKRILAAMKTLEVQGRLSSNAVDDLNRMANSSSAEVRDLVRREFGKYLKP